MEDYLENMSQSILELAKNTVISIHLEGWPATVALVSIPIAVVAICAINKITV